MTLAQPRVWAPPPPHPHPPGALRETFHNNENHNNHDNNRNQHFQSANPLHLITSRDSHKPVLQEQQRVPQLVRSRARVLTPFSRPLS